MATGRLSPLSIAIASYAGVAHLYALLALLPELSESGLVPYLVVVLAISAACAVAELLARSRLHYRLILVLHLLALAPGQYLLFSQPVAEIAVAGSLLLAIGLYERYPTNAITAAAALLLLATSRMFAVVPARGDPRSWTLIGVPLVQALIAALACSLTLLRERLIETQTHGNRLEQAIGKLTQANQEYQDYLIHVEAESTERERKRITRDIHDVVGYTLTNNIMLMEAAIDMARSNPIGVSKILNTARENAQEGLERIRESLYSFRRRKIFAPYGLRAVARLVETFQLATGIAVETEYSNVPLSLNASIDSTVYHLIQESMVNTLRHGRSTRIRILMQLHDGSFDVVIRDNGGTGDQAANEFTEGIGLKGMRERVSRLGGSLSAALRHDGFVVSASIPMQEAAGTSRERAGDD